MKKDEIKASAPSAWKENEKFAHWIVNRIQPEVTVELGVDWGYSLICLAEPGVGKVYGIDLWAPQHDPGSGSSRAYSQIANNFEICKKEGLDNIELIRADLNEESETWDKPIDILHIDARHEYACVKNDYDKWHGHLRKGGVILFHDTNSFPNDVGKFFQEIDRPKTNFPNVNGLGVVSDDKILIDEIRSMFSTT